MNYIIETLALANFNDLDAISKNDVVALTSDYHLPSDIDPESSRKIKKWISGNSPGIFLNFISFLKFGEL